MCSDLHFEATNLLLYVHTQAHMHVYTLELREINYLFRPSHFLINRDIEPRTFDSEYNVLPSASSSFKENSIKRLTK